MPKCVALVLGLVFCELFANSCHHYLPGRRVVAAVAAVWLMTHLQWAKSQ